MMDGKYYRDSIDNESSMSLGTYSPGRLFIDVDDPTNGGGVVVLSAPEVYRLIQNLTKWYEEES